MIKNRINNFNHVKPLLSAAVIVLVFLTTLLPVAAKTQDKYADCDYYELEEKSSYKYSDEDLVSSHSYGTQIGRIKVSGDIIADTSFRETKAYSVNSNISISYEYSGSYQSSVKTDWNLESDSGKSAAGYDFSSKIGKGILIVEKCYDGKSWNREKEYTNFFENYKTGLSDIIQTTDEEITKGTYYRITVAYEMQRENGKALGFLWPVYEHKKFVDVYTIFVLKDTNPLVIKDIVTRTKMTEPFNSDFGFVIDRSGSTCRVDITKDGNKIINCNDGASFTEQGNYTIEVTTNFGTKYTSIVTVSDGLEMKKIDPIVFITEDDYTNPQFLQPNTKTVYGAVSLTNLYLAQKDGSEIKNIEAEEYTGIDTYGINGDSFWIFARLNYGRALTSNGWSINEDKYGNYENEKVQDVTTGQVGFGAVIIQTSKDGHNWENADKGKYAQGLYTTDFCKHYSPESDIFLYMPSGRDIINGIYVRIMFAYEVANGAETKNYLERFEFYLCNNNLSAITFHNKTVADDLEESLSDKDTNTAKLYKYAESLRRNTLTVTGFTIDNSENPTVTYKVLKNGILISDNPVEFTETGKYDIFLESKVGDAEIITIYVDNEDLQTKFKRYFGISLITEDSKRIYNPEFDYPTFEGGKTRYHIEKTPDEFLPVSGVIKNVSREGVEIRIDASRSEKTGIISVPGEYVAELRVNPSFATDNPCGDDIVFTFHFYVIAEGTAPGPKANQESLAKYSHENISDSKPIYYCVTYSSAASGNISVAFATREEAIRFAREYEKGVVEQQNDGSFRYTGSMLVSQKQKINSSWDLADAIDYFANLAVEEKYFDLSDDFTFTTLSDEVIKKYSNLRQLELSKSVVIFGNNQKEQLTGYNKLHLLSPKPQHILSINGDGTATTTYDDFKFEKDKYGGIDSDRVIIIDSNGQEYNIEYSKGVGQQLSALGCPSGEITIREYTKYGDISEYKAVFIAENDNQTIVSIKYYEKDTEKNISFDSQSLKEPLLVDAFSIKEIKDALDDFPLVLVLFDGNPNPQKAYTTDSDFLELFTTPGEYTIKCVNRLGFSYEIPIIVNSDTGYSISVSFTGEGTATEKPIIVYLGETHVELPQLERYGYVLEGFKAPDGTVYSGEIEKILTKSNIVLEAVWRAKQFKVSFVDENRKSIYEDKTVSFGETITLPALGNEGSSFVWSCNGELIEGNTYKVSLEGDLIFKAVEDSATETQNTSSTELIDSSTSNKKSTPVIICAIAAGIVLVTIIVIIANLKVRKGKDNIDG